MSRFAGIPLLWLVAATFAVAEPPPDTKPVSKELPPLHDAPIAAKKIVYVIPVHGEIAKPIFFILRRGLKEAIDHKADAVVLDMDTPGGEGSVMLEMMEALDKFPGDKITYVNKEAISAGAIIASVSDEIYFAPKGVMGAADVIKSDGEDLPPTLKRKIDSYLSAKIEVYSRRDPRRAEVIKAMRVADFELKLDEKIIKPKGELLTLTAEKAIVLYGEPPSPLLAVGIAKDLDSLLAAKYSAAGFSKTTMNVTWSEELAQYLNAIAPVLLGLGLLALFIEFKVPGHGWIGGIGVVLLALFFFDHHVAGLSGHEPIIAFAIGLVMLAVEILFFPGVFVLAGAGIVLMLGSLLWSMADLWPNEPISISGDAFIAPLGSFSIGLAIAVLTGAALLRYLPKGWVWDKLVLAAAVDTTAQTSGVAPAFAGGLGSLIGRQGIAATALYPSGQVEIDGQRYEAKVEVGAIDAGAPVVVRGRTDFGLIVEKANT